MKQWQARNPLNQAGRKVLNLSVIRSFKMPFVESQHLEMRLEAFNALNTPQYAAPDANLGAGTFGQVTSTQINNRELQLAAKFSLLEGTAIRTVTCDSKSGKSFGRKARLSRAAK
jgi:hypothetical protein